MRRKKRAIIERSVLKCIYVSALNVRDNVPDTEKARHKKKQRNKLNPDSLIHVLSGDEHYVMIYSVHSILNDLLRYIRV